VAGVLTGSAGVLVRMKLAVLRHSVTGRRAADMSLGGVAGLALAGGTIWLAARTWPVDSLPLDLVASAFALWVVGWLFGPVVFGGGDETLRPEHLSLLPLRPRALATGLIAAAFVGVAPLVSLVAFTALIVAAVPLGPGPVAVAALAAVVQLVFVVVASRFVTGALGQLMRSKAGAVLAATISAGILALTHTGWVLKPTVEAALTSGFPDRLADWARALPSGWGVVAVEAAARGDWLLAAGALTGLVALTGLALLGWTALLVRRLSRRSARPPVSAGVRRPARAGAARAVAGRDLRTAVRDLMRFHYLVFALVYALVFCLLPLAVQIPVFVPFTGVAFGVWAAAVSANLYGEDGTALWQTILIPGAARHDVRGRQLAWLIIAAPGVLLLSVVPTLLSGQTWAWPWLAALVPALLGGGAGVVVLVSVLRPVPMTDPHKRSGNLLENGTDFTQVLMMLVLVALTATPAFLTVRYGTPWAGSVVGLLSGALLAWAFGELAARRLESGAPELLNDMRSAAARPSSLTGDVDWAAMGASVGEVDLGERRLGIAHASPARRAAVLALFSLCWFPLVAQAVVPAILHVTAPEQRGWFLSRHVPAAFEWPVVAAMALLGLAMLAAGWWQLRAARVESARVRHAATAAERQPVG
jgi:ABC-2 type transport system permease protein